MLADFSLAIKRFAKRQMTWFRRDPAMVWLDMAGDPLAQASAAVEAFGRAGVKDTQNGGRRESACPVNEPCNALLSLAS